MHIWGIRIEEVGLGQSLGILANVGVLLGILLLVYELSQNRQMIEAQTRTALAEGLSEHFYRISTDEGIADISYRGDAGEPLTDPERVRYQRLTLAQLSYQENVHYQYRIGLYDESEFAAQRARWTAAFGAKGFVEVWCVVRGAFSPEYVQEINGLLTTYKCE